MSILTQGGNSGKKKVNTEVSMSKSESRHLVTARCAATGQPACMVHLLRIELHQQAAGHLSRRTHPLFVDKDMYQPSSNGDSI